MGDIISEIAESYERKIVALEEEIQRLRRKKEMIISSLREDLGTQEGKSNVLPKISIPPISGESAHRVVKLTAHHRMLRALDKMSSEGFLSADLIKTASEDGHGDPLNTNRALKILSRFIEEGLVEVLTPRQGKRGGIYKKVIKPTTVESSPSGERDLQL